MKIPLRIHHELSYDPAVPRLGIYLKDEISIWKRYLRLRVHCNFDICAGYGLKQAKCPSVGEWVENVVCVYAMKCHSPSKGRNPAFATTQIDREHDAAQRKRQMLYDFTSMCNLLNVS